MQNLLDQRLEEEKATAPILIPSPHSIGSSILAKQSCERLFLYPPESRFGVCSIGCYLLDFVATALRWLLTVREQPLSLFVRDALFLALTDREEFGVAGRKCEVVNEIQPLLLKPVSYDISRACSAEIAKVLRLNHDSGRLSTIELSRFQPAAMYPLFNLTRVHMKSRSQCVFSEAVFAHLSVGAEPVKHMPN